MVAYFEAGFLFGASLGFAVRKVTLASPDVVMEAMQAPMKPMASGFASVQSETNLMSRLEKPFKRFKPFSGKNPGAV